MSLQGLQVLHIKSYNNQGNSENPLSSFKIVVNPFSPMTCARHVYLFTDPKDYDISSLHTYLTEHSSKCEWLTGTQAYDFLLRWAVGAESHKLKNNDHLVLGKIREEWSEYIHSGTVVDVTLIKIMQILLEDARHIRHAIQDTFVDPHAFRDILVKMCSNCVKSREAVQTPAYEALLQDHQEYIETAKTAFLEKKLTGISKSMKALNLKAEVEAILPSQINEASPPLRMFRTNLIYALQKQVFSRSQVTETTTPENPQGVSSNRSNLV